MQQSLSRAGIASLTCERDQVRGQTLMLVEQSDNESDEEVMLPIKTLSRFCQSASIRGGCEVNWPEADSAIPITTPTARSP